MAKRKKRASKRAPSRKRSSAPARRKSSRSKSSDPRSYRNMPEGPAGSFPRKVKRADGGQWTLTESKEGGKTVYVIKGFAKNKAKRLLRKDKAAEFMRRRAKEEKSLRANPHCKNPSKRKNPVSLRNNPMSDEDFISAMLINPMDDFDMEEVFFDDDEF